MRSSGLAVAFLTLFLAGCETGAKLAATADSVLGTGMATSYCRSSSRIYTLSGPCAAGDEEISSAQYQELYKQQAADETKISIEANEAARSAKTYCLTGTSKTPYIAASGKCQPSDTPLSESEYTQAKSDQANLLGAPTSSGLPTAAKTAEIAPPPAASLIQQPLAAPTSVGLNPETPVASSGSALFVSTNGILLTNHHVVDGCRALGVIANGGAHVAFKVADDPSLDLALLKSDLTSNVTASFASYNPVMGETAFSAGYPQSDPLWSLILQRGSVTSTNALGAQALLATSATVERNNSSGPIFDASGHVIGFEVNSSLETSSPLSNAALGATAIAPFLEGAGITPNAAERMPAETPSNVAATVAPIVLPALCYR